MNRRHFLKTLAAGSAAAILPGTAFSANLIQRSRRKPNVILIYTDDQGSVDMNAYGADDLHTPHMDDLAARGVRFTQFYAAAPVCSPSRAALMTGRYPQRAGLPHNAPSMEGKPGMPGAQITIAEMMKEGGYTTGHIGKWHMGYTPDTMPNQQGFDYSFGHMGGCIDNYSHFFYWNGPNRHDLWRNEKEIWEDGKFFGDLMVEECNQFLEEHQDEPFFLYWAINFPHYPLQDTEKWREKYQHLDAPRRMYAAFISTMDEMIGQVLAKLDALNLREDTIVIFQSDHGHSTEERTFGGGGSNGPYRGAKFSLFEGGIRVPAIISWPGQIPASEVRDQMATNCDWYPTIAELCKLPEPDHSIDGKSLVSILDSSDASTHYDVFHWQSGRSQWGRQWAVRQGDWKLIGNPRDTSNEGKLTDADRLFLVNLAEDVSEMQNLASQHPERVQNMTKLHDDWISQFEQE